MKNTHTRTHTHFFDQQMLAEMIELAERMSEDWQSRAGFVDEETRDSGDARMVTLFAALRLCSD